MIKTYSNRLTQVSAHPTKFAVAVLSVLGVLTAAARIKADEGEPEVDGAKVIEKSVADWKQRRIRFVKSYPVPVLVRPPMYFRFPRPTVNLYNGEKYFRWDEPLRNPDGTSELILITPKRSVRLMVGLEYDPIAFTTGNIPTNGVASSEPDGLRTTLSADRFRYLGTAFHDSIMAVKSWR